MEALTNAESTYQQAREVAAKFDQRLTDAQAMGSADDALTAIAYLVAELSGMLKGVAFCDVRLTSDQCDTMLPDIHRKVVEAKGFITKKLVAVGFDAGVRSQQVAE